MITAIVIDDEAHSRTVLKTLLARYCPDIRVCGEADSADSAHELILRQKPQLVFLDIRMPGKSGFDLLKRFREIGFEVIFVSAFDEYAIKAFEFNALDYILKPIDYVKLTRAVGRAIAKINADNRNENVLHFIKTLDEKEDLVSKFSLHHNGKVVFVNVNAIACIEAKLGCCEIQLAGGERYSSCKDLKQFESILQPAGNFVRISKSVLLNIDYMKGYSKGEVCVIEMVSGQHFEVSRRKKTEIINRLRACIR